MSEIITDISVEQPSERLQHADHQDGVAQAAPHGDSRLAADRPRRRPSPEAAFVLSLLQENVNQWYSPPRRRP